MPQNAAAAGSSMLTRRLTFLIKLPPAFLRISSLLLDSWSASLSAYATRFGWEPRDMNFNFRLSLKAKEALLRRGFLRR